MAEDYYVEMDGVKCDRKLIELADGAVAGKGDGRISIDDAKALFSAAQDNDNYTDVEKATMSYIRENYKFTVEADSWFRTEVRKWAGTKGH
jgi:hypothetical protein